MVLKRFPGIYLSCLMIWTFFSVLTLSAQSNIEFKDLSFPELSQNQVNDIAQDKKGYIWLATYDGVFKYNGYQIERPFAQNNKGESLPIEPASYLCYSQDDHLWIVYFNEALVDLNLKTNVFIAYKHKDNEIGGLSSNTINCITKDKSGKLWIGTNSGIDCFDGQKKKFTHFGKNLPGLESDTVSALAVDNNDNLYIGSGSKFRGLYYLDKKTMSVSKVFNHLKNDDYYEVNSMTIDNGSNIWCSNQGCTYMIEP